VVFGIILMNFLWVSYTFFSFSETRFVLSGEVSDRNAVWWEYNLSELSDIMELTNGVYNIWKG